MILENLAFTNLLLLVISGLYAYNSIIKPAISTSRIKDMRNSIEDIEFTAIQIKKLVEEVQATNKKANKLMDFGAAYQEMLIQYTPPEQAAMIKANLEKAKAEEQKIIQQKIFQRKVS